MNKAVIASHCSDRLSSGTMTFLYHTLKTDIRKKKKEMNPFVIRQPKAIKPSTSVNRDLWILA